MKNLLLFIFLILSNLLQSQSITAQWAENLWANASPGTPGQNYNSTSSHTVMCSDGSFYATFSFFDSLKVRDKYYNALGAEDLMVAKYSKNQHLQWTYTIHNSKKLRMYMQHIFLGENNSLYLVIEYDSAITFGTDTLLLSIPLSTFDKRNAVVAKLSAMGKFEWLQDFQTSVPLVGRSYGEGFLITNFSGNDIKWNGTIYRRGSSLHFNGSGVMDYVYDSLGQYYYDIRNNSDSDVFVRGTVSNNSYSRMGTDTIRSNNEGKVGFYVCIAKKGRKTKWSYTIKNKAYDSPDYQDHQMTIDKYGNSYFIDRFGGDSVWVENKWHHFKTNGAYAGLLQLNKNGGFLNFICDSMAEPAEDQAMTINLSPDSTKLLLAVYFKGTFWFPGVGNFSGNRPVVFVLDITQNLKCIKYYLLSPNTIYSFNPWDIPSYANCVSLVFVNNLQTDTINTINTGKNNVAIVYYSDKKTLGFDRIDDGKYFSFNPNPCNNILSYNGSNINLLEIINLQGKVVFKEDLQFKGEINVQELPPGIYFMRVNNMISFKFIKL